MVDVLVKSLNKSIKGKVTEVSTSAKNTGGQFLVKVELEKQMLIYYQECLLPFNFLLRGNKIRL